MKIFLLFILPFVSMAVSAQQKEAADQLVNEGTALQDAGQSDSAMFLYKQALGLDKDNLLALAEMAYSLLLVEKYDESISYSKRAIKTHAHDPILKTVYVSYGNALDGLKKTEKSIEIYNEGIRLFPEYYRLYFNRGISQINGNKRAEALLSFQRSAELNPDYASSHNAIGHVLFNTNRIPSLLAFCRFMALESGTKRASENLNNIQAIMNAHVSKGEENRVSVNLTPDMLDSDKKNKPDNFSSVELMLALSSAMDNDSVSVNQTGTEKFIRKFSSFCRYLKENEKDNYGFYWDYYVPYFTEMIDKDLVTVFGYLVFTTTKTADVNEWLGSHKNEITGFYKWSDGFKWRIN